MDRREFLKRSGLVVAVVSGIRIPDAAPVPAAEVAPGTLYAALYSGDPRFNPEVSYSGYARVALSPTVPGPVTFPALNARKMVVDYVGILDEDDELLIIEPLPHVAVDGDSVSVQFPKVTSS